MAERLRLISTPGLGYRYQVVHANGLPEIRLTLFADHLQRSMSASSVPQYMRELLAFANWASADSVAAHHAWNLYSRAEYVRELVREYLTTEARCRLTVRPDLAGLRVTYVRATDSTKVNVRTLLAALKRLYDFLVTHAQYPDRNPLLHEDAENAGDRVWEGYSRAIHAARGRNPMPPQAGLMSAAPSAFPKTISAITAKTGFRRRSTIETFRAWCTSPERSSDGAYVKCASRGACSNPVPESRKSWA